MPAQPRLPHTCPTTVVIAILLLCQLAVQTTAPTHDMAICPTPMPCHCIGDDIIFCAFKRLKEIPFFLEFNSVWDRMNLSENLLTSIPGSKFVGARIRKLDLSSNIIETIDPEAFVGFSELESLDMSHNRLPSIPSQTLSPLVDLRILRMRYNRFRYVNAKTFSGIKSLTHLDLAGNDLTRVPSEALRPLSHLKVLNLRNNKIKVVHGYAFEGLPLEVLDLGDNKAPMVLETRAFCGQEPRVSHEERNVVEWAGMYTLSLDHNGLSFIDPCIAKLVWTLTKMDVAGNPIRCDCRLYMFRNWGTRTKFPQAQCDSPVKFAGEMVDKLEQSRFNCSHREQYARCDNLCQPATSATNRAGRTSSLTLLHITLIVIGLVLITDTRCRFYRITHQAAVSLTYI